MEIMNNLFIMENLEITSIWDVNNIVYCYRKPIYMYIYKYIWTSTAHRISNTWCQLLAIEILLTIFRLVTFLNEVSWSFKIKGNLRQNQISIYDFTAKLFSCSFLVTMIPSIHNKCLSSNCCVDISL